MPTITVEKWTGTYSEMFTWVKSTTWAEAVKSWRSMKPITVAGTEKKNVCTRSNTTKLLF